MQQKMKRKIIAFPPAPVKAGSAVQACTIAPSAPVPAGKQNSVSLSAVRAKDLVILLSLLPERHTLSLALASQVENLTTEQGLDSCITVISAKVVSLGLVEVEFIVNNTRGDHGAYDFSSWIVQIGGEGPGLDSDVQLSAVSDDKKAPVAVRFAVPISHPLVDDIGFVDSAVWSMLRSDVSSLVEIVNMLGSFLVGPTRIDSEDEVLVARYEESWTSAQRHTKNKYALMEEFQGISKHPQFLGNRLSCDNLTVASWLRPEFVDMIGKLKSALLEASSSEPGFNAGDTSITALMNFNSAKKVVSAWVGYVTENCDGIFSFDLFTKEFCNSFVEEMALYEQSSLPRRRPNTMNNYGLILNDIGMYGLMTALMAEYLVPLVQVLYSEEPVAYGLDHHHSFIVQYKRSSAETAATLGTTLPLGDKGLDMHHDSSEVTVNVCLGKEGFVGGGLRFCGLKGSADYRKLQYTLKHVIGRAVVHLGRHRHGADDLLPPVGLSAAAQPGLDVATAATPKASDVVPEVSERLNLIMWLRSSAFRRAAAYGRINPDGFPRSPEPEGFEPDVCCLSKFNDADYIQQVERATKIVQA